MLGFAAVHTVGPPCLTPSQAYHGTSGKKNTHAGQNSHLHSRATAAGSRGFSTRSTTRSPTNTVSPATETAHGPAAIARFSGSAAAVPRVATESTTNGAHTAAATAAQTKNRPAGAPDNPAAT